MKRCNACHVNIKSHVSQCPLCGGAVTPVEGSEKSHNPYPVPVLEKYLKPIVIRILLAASVISIFASIGVNVLLEGANQFVWWPYVVYGIIYAWLAGRPAWKTTRNSASIVLGETILLLLSCVGLDFLIGYSGWSVKWALPSILLGGIIASVIFYIVKPKKREHYALFEVISSILGFLPIILYYCGVPQNKYLALGTAGAGVCCILMVWVVGGKQTVQEITRRLKF
ncbi:MAG: DUF6320 domain-containing protein [Oscillospiraceae bacterium]